MLKKLLSRFRRNVETEIVIQTVQEEYYQPELPFFN